MFDKILLNRYKELSKENKNDLFYFLLLDGYFKYKKALPENFALKVCDVANSCWEYDEQKLDARCYLKYILDNFYQGKGTFLPFQILEIDVLVDAYHNGIDGKQLLEDVQYAFTTSDAVKYYIVNENMYAIDSNGEIVLKPNPMMIINDIMFDLFKNDKIVDVSMDTHYDIRCIIENGIHDEELMERDRDGIEGYKRYCLKHFITKEDISDAVGLDIDYNLTEIDGIYTSENKLKKLYENSKENFDNSVYVASFTNGTDYYYNKSKKLYIAIDKNNVTKFFDDNSLLLLKQLKKGDKFAYIDERFAKNIMKIIEHDYTRNNFKHFLNFHSSILSLWEYGTNKGLNFFNDLCLQSSIVGTLIIEASYRENLRRKRVEKIMR